MLVAGEDPHAALGTVDLMRPRLRLEPANPTTATSSGTWRPAACGTSRAPMAMRSDAVKMPSMSE
jgi:hypothetical protein